MKPTRHHWHLVLFFVPDVLRGSWLLAQFAMQGLPRLYRRARQAAATGPAPARLRKPQKASRASGRPEDAPAAAGAEKTQAAPTAGEPKPSETTLTGGKPAAGGRKRRAWTLDHLAGAVFFGFVAWCFTRHSLASCWGAVVAAMPAVGPWLLGLWIPAAWLTAQFDKPQGRPPAVSAVEGDAGGPDAGDVRAAGYWFWHLVCVRVRDAVAEARRGIHLKALLDEPGIPASWTVTTLREHCERLGVPVKLMQIRGSGGGPTHGVHVDQLNAALGMPLDQAVAALEELLARPAANTLPDAVERGPVDTAEEAPADPDSRSRKRWTFEELLGAYFAGAPGPTSTPRPAPLPDPSPASPGRG